MTTVSTTEPTTPIERLRGMPDIGPEVYRRREAIRHTLQAILEQHGYQFIEPPVVEATELFLRKSGPERVAQIYALRYRNRDIALRPEHTASVLRYYVEELQNEPLPLRLAYVGPVFRYERPQAGRSRQFTELGCELLGAPSPYGDAEIVHLAVESVTELGLTPRLVVGHIGIVLEFLDRLPLRQRVRDWLLWSMERLRKGQPVDVDAALESLSGNERLVALYHELGHELRDISPERLERWVLGMLREVGVQLSGGSRTPEEIVAGVLAKLSRVQDREHILQAFAFTRELAALEGPPAEVLPQLRMLLDRHALDPTPIQQIEAVLQLLRAYGVEEDTVVLSPGMARGLHYYTGVLFEVYAAEQPHLQLCGGGRYDDLAQLLGARQPLPACGFSCGLERLTELARVPGPSLPDITLVAPVTQEAMPHAIATAEALRQRNVQVELDVRGRSPNANRRYARRRGISHVIFVEADGTTRVEQLPLRQDGQE